jgi:hypothetical protein
MTANKAVLNTEQRKQNSMKMLNAQVSMFNECPNGQSINVLNHYNIVHSLKIATLKGGACA